MTSQISVGNLQVAKVFFELINDEVIPDSGITSDRFWRQLADIIDELAPKNRQLLQHRELLQRQIDTWHQTHGRLAGREHDPIAYKAFLQEIGYLLPEGDDFTITTANVDSEIAHQAGPQLVVPLKNARFAINAANARWGSLYDALYGSDAIDEAGGAEKGEAYNPVRGDKVIAFAKQHLDRLAPLQQGSHAQVVRYYIQESPQSSGIQTGTGSQTPAANTAKGVLNELVMELVDGSQTRLREGEKYRGYCGEQDQPTAILLKNNGLHVEIQIDASHLIGRSDLANVKDLLLEAAITTIMDCEDSVAAVDPEDKCELYRNWLGLMQGELTADMVKAGQKFTRTLNPDRHYHSSTATPLTLPGRSLLFIRTVGHLMTSSCVIDRDGREVPEGILDTMVSVLVALHDLNTAGSIIEAEGSQKETGVIRNSRTGSIYLVKPKMHGPEEVAFTCELFSKVETAFNLAPNTIKLGIMDEERRTTLNLKACIRVASERLVFINTGFLDRTGDEIHTSMLAGPFVPKSQMKQQRWISAYENANVDIGLACGLPGKAQIGKGMWAMPDEMAAMLTQKIAHPQAGANTAWVPSPTAAVLHSTHYHQVDVLARQRELAGRPQASVDDILTLALLTEELTPEQVRLELDNNVQGILGYVVRWIDSGLGCSKVPDINNIGLMEDRATLRISSQHIANWLIHGICSEEQVMASLKTMAVVVDKQNAGASDYHNMAPHCDGIAFKPACALILQGKEQPSGYTEPLLHAYRIEAKANGAS